MAVTINNTSGSIYANYANVKETFPVSVTPSDALEGEVLTVDTIVPGTGYTTSAVATATTSTGTGTGMTVTYTAVAGGVTVVTIVDGGLGYAVGDTQTIIAGSSDATFDVATASANLVTIADRDVTGVYSKFTTDFQKGDYIWVKDNDNLRRIESITSDNHMTLQHSATTEASSTYGLIKRAGYETVAFVVDAVDAVEINGISIPKSVSDSFPTNKKFFPILINSSVNGNSVIVTAKVC